MSDNANVAVLVAAMLIQNEFSVLQNLAHILMEVLVFRQNGHHPSPTHGGGQRKAATFALIRPVCAYATSRLCPSFLWKSSLERRRARPHNSSGWKLARQPAPIICSHLSSPLRTTKCTRNLRRHLYIMLWHPADSHFLPSSASGRDGSCCCRLAPPAFQFELKLGL